MTNICRLCGEQKSHSYFNVKLNDKSTGDKTYQELLNLHIQTKLNPCSLLPQNICNDCKHTIELFSSFAIRLEEVQTSFQETKPEEDTKAFNTVLMPIDEITEVEEPDDLDKVPTIKIKRVTRGSLKRRALKRTVEDLFRNELDGTSSVRLEQCMDLPSSEKLDNGQLSESCIGSLGLIKWSELFPICQLCNEPVNNILELNCHLISSHNLMDLKVSCPLLCSISFKRAHGMINHIISKHYNLEYLKFSCLCCSTQFHDLVSLQHHVKSSHPVAFNQIFQCLICGHHSDTFKQLGIHRETHFKDEAECFARLSQHPNDEQTKNNILDIDSFFKNEDGSVTADGQDLVTKWSAFKHDCSLCSLAKDLSPIEYFMHHQNNHLDEESSKFYCAECPLKDFSTLMSFFNHQTSAHCREMSFCCIVCEKLFWNHVGLLNHLRIHHSSFKFFYCCGRLFDRFQMYRRHLDTTHSINETPKRITEKLCNESSTNNRLLRPRCSKIEEIDIKEEQESDTEINDSESEYKADYAEMESSIVGDDSNKCKLSTSKRRPRAVAKYKHFYGPEINTIEKLYHEELEGSSRFQIIQHLNIDESLKLENGEVPEENAKELNPLRWHQVLSCIICKLPFQTINDLVKHIRKTHNTRAICYGCINCDAEFTCISESVLVNHLVDRHHLDHLKFCCLICSKLYYDARSLLNHYKTHKEDVFKILMCPICCWYARTMDDLKEHKYLNHFIAERSENQQICDQVFEKFASGIEANPINPYVAEDERNLNGTVTANCQERLTVKWNFGLYECPKCIIQYLNPLDFFVHLRLKHPKEVGKKKFYHCTECTEKQDFSGFHVFVSHASEHQENLMFTCLLCQKLHWNFLALANHYKEVHSSFTVIFCIHCGKLFSSVTKAIGHYQKHKLTEEIAQEGKITKQSLICYICAKIMKSASILANHIKTHNTDESELSNCNICGQTYKNKYKLAQHIKVHENLRRWSCNYCPSAFNFKKTLDTHIRSCHWNERKHACSVCPKRFNTKYDLTVHVRLHFGDFPYICSVPGCEAKYPAWSNLSKHCKSRHNLDIRSERFKKIRATQSAVADEHDQSQ